MSEIETSDPRPANCRFRLQDEGKAYPRSSCMSCGRTVLGELGNKCGVYRPTTAVGDGEPPLPKKPGGATPTKTLRDWFAGQALIGLVPILGAPEDGPDSLWDESIAERAYAIADAMLAKRSQP